MRSTIFLALLLVLIALPILGCSQTESESPPEAEAPAAEAESEQLPEPGSDDAMVLIPGGEYTIGSDLRPERQPDNPQWYEPAHKVDVDPFYIDAYEVTFLQFLKFDVADDREHKILGDWRRFYQTGKEYYPVPNVAFEDAEAYCEWAGKRLPTEIEWEVAARGPEAFRFPWGDEWSAGLAHTNETGIPDIQEVTAFPQDRSPFGVFDMLGNVQEWTSSMMRPYPRSPARRESVFTHNLRVVRGASYAIKAKGTGLYLRFGYLDLSQNGTGFRCVKDASEEGSSSQ